MNLRRLKYFVKIVDIGSLTQAAEVLHIAQPALSQQVATLEGEMDQQLLIRTKRGVTPTEAGKILYTHARTILRQCEQAQLAVNNVGQTLLKEDLYLVGTRDCPGQSVDLTAVAEMNLFLPRDYSAVRARVTEAFTLRRLSAKIIGEIESITTLTAAIASGMGATVLPESAARSLCGAANGWMARISTPSMSLSLSLNMSARGSLSPQAQAVKEILLSLVSRPSLENRELQLVS